MGDTGEAFKDFNDYKRRERSIKEPKRMKYALQRLDGLSTKRIGDERIIIYLREGTITLWPYSGWFQGQKPYGKIRGRGVKELIKVLRGMSNKERNLEDVRQSND